MYTRELPYNIIERSRMKQIIKSPSIASLMISNNFSNFCMLCARIRFSIELPSRSVYSTAIVVTAKCICATLARVHINGRFFICICIYIFRKLLFFFRLFLRDYIIGLGFPPLGIFILSTAGVYNLLN
jgi:hypothetical protein